MRGFYAPDSSKPKKNHNKEKIVKTQKWAKISPIAIRSLGWVLHVYQKKTIFKFLFAHYLGHVNRFRIFKNKFWQSNLRFLFAVAYLLFGLFSFGANGRIPDEQVTVKCGIHNRLVIHSVLIINKSLFIYVFIFVVYALQFLLLFREY